jgi:hypothetical protein
MLLLHYSQSQRLLPCATAAAAARLFVAAGQPRHPLLLLPGLKTVQP